MKKQDIFFWGIIILLFLPFLISGKVLGIYLELNQQHGMLMAFVKFALLATLGEIIGLRIKTGSYFQPGFGILPRMVVWGFLGLTIKMAFIIFSSGTPLFLEYLGVNDARSVLAGPPGAGKVSVAFATSAALNLVYAPVMMTFHKITDTHILSTGGTLRGFFKPVPISKIFVNLNWDVMWNFVFKKTIPFFWIPAHTLTFLLPPDQQVLFAALLGVALGTILAVAGRMEKKT
ncbi:MAG: hypothetical protein L3J31_03505 [Bacteroidales bacterium]|nr:hypothetical protein [Bacteroidales bacterium]MCF6341855.1 hypothetical protein [Bacteroidales bacterium]